MTSPYVRVLEDGKFVKHPPVWRDAEFVDAAEARATRSIVATHYKAKIFAKSQTRCFLILNLCLNQKWCFLS